MKPCRFSKRIVSQLPRVELRFAARYMLIKGIETEFACRILGDLGTTEDLPYLHTELNNRDKHTVVKMPWSEFRSAPISFGVRL